MTKQSPSLELAVAFLHDAVRDLAMAAPASGVSSDYVHSARGKLKKAREHLLKPERAAVLWCEGMTVGGALEAMSWREGMTVGAAAAATRAGALYERLTADPARRELPEVGIPVMAMSDGKREPTDIAHLDKDSLLAWLRQEGGENRLAENTLGIILGHEGRLS